MLEDVEERSLPTLNWTQKPLSQCLRLSENRDGVEARPVVQGKWVEVERLVSGVLAFLITDQMPGRRSIRED